MISPFVVSKEVILATSLNQEPNSLHSLTSLTV